MSTDCQRFRAALRITREFDPTGVIEEQILSMSIAKARWHAIYGLRSEGFLARALEKPPHVSCSAPSAEILRRSDSR